MSSNETKIINQIYNATLLTLAAVGVSMTSKKVIGEPLGTPQNINGTLKLAGAVMIGSILVKYLEDKKIIPDKIDK